MKKIVNMRLYLDAPAGPGRPPAVLSTHGAQAEPSASLHPPARAALRVGAGDMNTIILFNYIWRHLATRTVTITIIFL